MVQVPWMNLPQMVRDEYKRMRGVRDMPGIRESQVRFLSEGVAVMCEVDGVHVINFVLKTSPTVHWIGSFVRE